MAGSRFQQEPVAIVGFACRLPGGNHSPQKLWDFLERGDVASNKVPASRYNIDGRKLLPSCPIHPNTPRVLSTVLKLSKRIYMNHYESTTH